MSTDIPTSTPDSLEITQTSTSSPFSNDYSTTTFGGSLKRKKTNKTNKKSKKIKKRRLSRNNKKFSYRKHR